MDWKDEKEKVYYKIGEVADILKVGTYVVRYWEKEFKFIKPLKLNSSHRLYSKKEIEKLLVVKDLLYDKKFTIKGAKNALKSGSYKLIGADAVNNAAKTSKCANNAVLQNNSAVTNSVSSGNAENNNNGSDGLDITDIDIIGIKDRNKNQSDYAAHNSKMSERSENLGYIDAGKIIEELKIIKNILFQNIHK